MSNYKTKAKKPNGTEFEEVSMLDNFFGQHNYGVEFPDGAIYRPEKCDFKEEKSKTPNQDIINEFEKVSYDIDDEDFNINREPVIAFNEAVKVATQFIEKAISQTEKEAYEKGRLETIKEIEEKVNKYNSEMIAKYWKDKTETSFNVAILDIKSILNQLKDNGKY